MTATRLLTVSAVILALLSARASAVAQAACNAGGFAFATPVNDTTLTGNVPVVGVVRNACPISAVTLLFACWDRDGSTGPEWRQISSSQPTHIAGADVSVQFQWEAARPYRGRVTANCGRSSRTRMAVQSTTLSLSERRHQRQFHLWSAGRKRKLHRLSGRNMRCGVCRCHGFLRRRLQHRCRRPECSASSGRVYSARLFFDAISGCSDRPSLQAWWYCNTKPTSTSVLQIAGAA
jgi:hypothetical protein